MADKMKAMIPRKFWINTRFRNNYSELFAHYYLIKHPNSVEHPDYVAKIPESYIIFFNAKPSEIEAPEDYIFQFEKWHKEPDKRYPKLKADISELRKLYPLDDNERFCFFSYNIYDTIGMTYKIVDRKIELFLIDKDNEWLSNPNNLNERKKAQAKGSRVIRILDFSDQSYLKYLDLNNQYDNILSDIKKINKIQNLTNTYFDEMYIRAKSRVFEKLTEACCKNAEDNLNLIANASLKLEEEKKNIELNLFSIVYNVDFYDILHKECWFDFEDDERSFRGEIIDLNYPLVVVRNKHTNKISKTFFERIKII